VRRHRLTTLSLITAVRLDPGGHLPAAVISPWLAVGQDAWRERSSIPGSPLDVAVLRLPAGPVVLWQSNKRFHPTRRDGALD